VRFFDKILNKELNFYTLDRITIGEIEDGVFDISNLKKARVQKKREELLEKL
jgi:hypothetical protein